MNTEDQLEVSRQRGREAAMKAKQKKRRIPPNLTRNDGPMEGKKRQSSTTRLTINHSFCYVHKESHSWALCPANPENATDD